MTCCRNPVRDGYFAGFFEVLTSPDLVSGQSVGAASRPSTRRWGRTAGRPRWRSGTAGTGCPTRSAGATPGTTGGWRSRTARSARSVTRGSTSRPTSGSRSTRTRSRTPTAPGICSTPVTCSRASGSARCRPSTCSTPPAGCGGEPRSVRTPRGDGQIHQRDREIYGARCDSHALEGPSVLVHGGRYYCFCSGGSWLEAGCAVAYAAAEHPLGPEYLVHHAWDEARTARRMCIDPPVWTAEGPHVLGPSYPPTSLERSE